MQQSLNPNWKSSSLQTWYLFLCWWILFVGLFLQSHRIITTLCKSCQKMDETLRHYLWQIMLYNINFTKQKCNIAIHNILSLYLIILCTFSSIPLRGFPHVHKLYKKLWDTGKYNILSLPLVAHVMWFPSRYAYKWFWYIICLCLWNDKRWI